LIEGINGTLLLDKTRLEIKADSAMTYAVKLEQVKATIADVDANEALLQVTGNANGPLQDMVRLTNTSPVKDMIDHFTEATRTTGNAKLGLKLDLPLAHMDSSKVAGSITFQNNDVALLYGLPLMQRVNGRLDFTEGGITLSGITGQFVGGPMRLDGATRADGLIEIRGDGTANLGNLQNNVPGNAQNNAPNNAQNPRNLLGDVVFVQRLAERLSGSARYTVALNVRARAAPISTTGTATAAAPLLVVESTLSGLGINLPEPLKKPAAESWPLRVEIVAQPGPVRAPTPTAGTAGAAAAASTAPAADLIRLRLGSILNAVFERRANRQGSMQITRAAYGVNEAAVLNDSSTYANINLKSLDVDAWSAVLRQLSASSGTAPTAADTTTASGNSSTSNLKDTIKSAETLTTDNYLPEVFALRAGDLRVGGKNFANIVAAVSKMNTAGSNDIAWQANIEAEQVSGYVTWRRGARQDLFTARLARLKIPQSVAAESNLDSVLDSTSDEIPALDIIADNFELSGKKMGKLELQATNTIASASNFNRREWQLQKLNITNDDAKLEATGVWGPEISLANPAEAPAAAPATGAATRTAPRLRTRLKFSVNASNVGKLMDRFGSKDTVRNGTALLEGEVAWRGSALSIDYASLSGRMRLEANKGQFLQAEPGIAKLLGVLSLQSLPRRLTLDFRDVFSEGFAFDEIRSNLTVENGIASTQDFKMRGVQATVLIEGSADLGRETQNLHVLVLPEINVGAASLGYAALANPAIGLATFLAQYVLRDPLTKAFSYEYNISGSWAEPNTSKIERGLLAPASLAPSSTPSVALPALPAAPTLTKPAGGTAAQPTDR
jgi:uncharacterized protein (TIGR02099 family)